MKALKHRPHSSLIGHWSLAIRPSPLGPSFFVIAAIAFVALLGIAAKTPAANATYTNPVLAGDYPDPSVIRVGKEYWATATSSEWSPQFPLLHSTDLVNWEIVGSVFSNRPAWSVANYWAPEIAEHKGRYFIYYVGRKKGGPLAVAAASSDKPSGPYVDHGVLVAQDAGSIDAVPFNDEKGERYLIWKEDGNSRRLPTIIWAQRLNEDGAKLLGERKDLIRNDAPWEGAVVEGPFIVPREGWFYLFYSGSGCCGAGCNYALGVARSRSLLGPWEKNPANPILAGNASWKCPGHGSIVTDEQGRYWLLYHAYSARDSVFTGRQMLLDEVTFAENGWPTINSGKGPSNRAPSPLGAPHRRTELEFTDTFDGPELRPGWNWPVGDNSPARLATGKLVLQAQSPHATNILGAVLGRSITVGNFAAATELDLSALKPGVWAGLAAVGDRANATGIAAGDAKVIVWRRAKQQHQVLGEAPMPKAESLRLRLTATGGQSYQFAYSSDGQKWTDIAAETSGKHLPPWDRAVRVALTVGGTEDAEARFDSLQIVPRGQ